MTVQPQDELVSKSEFARRRGISRTWIKQLVNEGLPVEGGKVPMAKAVAWIDANLDPARRNHWGNRSHANALSGGNSNAKHVSLLNGGSLNDLRRERERIKVDASALELARSKGELVERAAVRKFLTDRARMERDQWLAWSSAAAARLASALGVDTGKLFAALESEVRDHLRQLAEQPLESTDDNRVA